MASCESPPSASAPSKPRPRRRGLTLAGWNELRSSLLRPRRFHPKPWLTSLALHGLLIAILSCIAFERQGHLGDESIWALIDDGGEDPRTIPSEIPELVLPLKLEDVPAEQGAGLLVVPDPERDAGVGVSPELEVVRAPEPAVREPVAPQAKEAPKERTSRQAKGKRKGTSSRTAVVAHPTTSGRTGAAKANLLRRFGGTPKTEEAVQLGLRWLLQQQANDGGWYLSGPYSDGMMNVENRVAATSMALLAFLGAGHTHQDGDYQRQVSAGLHWLAERQNPKTGSFGKDAPMHHTFYTHAQATLVLSEAFAMTQDRWLKPPAELALSYAIKSQGQQGGWRYDYRGDSDTSVTGWMVMALVSGKAAGLVIPDRTFLGVARWLDQVETDDGATYAYKEGRSPTPSMTAEGLVCRMYLGWSRNNPAIDGGMARLLDVAPFRVEEQSFYYWYYATQLLHHADGPAWKQWNTAMREQLPRIQVKEGPETGSWSPGGPSLDRSAGRLYSTCMAIYCLEVYYRHMPIYESTWNEASPDS